MYCCDLPTPVKNPMSSAAAALGGAAAALALTGFSAWLIAKYVAQEARRRRASRFRVIEETDSEGQPIVVLTYDSDDGFLRISEFYDMPETDVPDPITRANEWIGRMTA